MKKAKIMASVGVALLSGCSVKNYTRKNPMVFSAKNNNTIETVNTTVYSTDDTDNTVVIKLNDNQLYSFYGYGFHKGDQVTCEVLHNEDTLMIVTCKVVE